MTHVQKTMVVKKFYQIPCWKLSELKGIRRPNGSPHGNNEMFNETMTVVLLFQIGLKGDAVIIGSNEFQRFTPESKRIPKHPEK